jgi:thioredoxin 2
MTAGSSSVLECPVCGRKNRVPAAAAGTPRCGQCGSPLPWVVEAGDDSYAEVADRAQLPVLVDLWAPWCGPCRAVSPALEQMARDHAGEIKLVKVNVDHAPQVAQRFGVQGIPTLLVTNGGDVVARQTGAAPEPALRQWLDQALASVGQTSA